MVFNFHPILILFWFFFLVKSEWDSVFICRRVLAVIGLVHCPSNPDLDVPYEEFQSAMKAFPDAFQKRCLAFGSWSKVIKSKISYQHLLEPLDSQQDLIERQDLIMYDLRTCAHHFFTMNRVPNSDTKRLQFYVQTVMMDVVERLVCVSSAAKEIPKNLFLSVLVGRLFRRCWIPFDH